MGAIGQGLIACYRNVRDVELFADDQIAAPTARHVRAGATAIADTLDLERRVFDRLVRYAQATP